MLSVTKYIECDNETCLKRIEVQESITPEDWITIIQGEEVFHCCSWDCVKSVSEDLIEWLKMSEKDQIESAKQTLKEVALALKASQK